MYKLTLKKHQYLEFEKLAIGAFSPLVGFMTETEFNSVVNDLRLPDGKIFPLPVLLDIDRTIYLKILKLSEILLSFDGREVGLGIREP